MSWISRLFKGEEKPKYIDFPTHWRSVLLDKIQYYRSLDGEQRARFEKAVLRFLNTTKITGIKTNVDENDIILIGASAIIPIFAFPNWEYHNLDEVLLYPEHIKYSPGDGIKDVNALGMVGYGYMEGKMMLSKKALHLGFENTKDKQNTAVHEFVHLIDKMDGKVDGIMVYLKEEKYVVPWLNLIDQKIEEIINEENDIRPYGATNRSEFLAVASEYFFERPHLFKENYPELYHYMELMFNQKLTNRKLVDRAKPTRHWDPCPCGSGKKFRDCCGK